MIPQNQDTNNYEEIQTISQNGQDIEYGFIHGNCTIVFIKAGMKGSIYGYQNKYLTISQSLNKKHGCTVVVSSNPNGLGDNFESEMNLLKTYAENHGFKNFKVYYMGHSIGATLGIVHAYKYPEIEKLVCINGPLNINPPLLVEGIKNFSGEKMNLIYGSLDPSFAMSNLYSELESDKIEFVNVKGADHNFTGALEFFMALPGFFFFGDEIDCKNVKIKK